VIVVFLLLGDSPTSESYVPKFRNTLYEDGTNTVSRNVWT